MAKSKEPAPDRAIDALVSEAVQLPSVDEMVASLQEQGYRVSIDEPPQRRVRVAPKNTKHYRFGVVSDTHLGSKFQQLSYLQSDYETFAREGVELVVHVGDLVHGSWKMHRDMALECHTHGAHAQTQYAIEHYPRHDGIRTLIIDGNHDQSFRNDGGAEVVQDFAAARPDVEYVGSRGAYIEIGPLSVYLWHPTRGSAYARSYKLQKWIEQVAPENKPHIVLTGHWHIACHLAAYRNVEGLLVPCYQSQTLYEKTLGLDPVIGGLIIDVWASKDGLEDMQTRWMIHRQPIPNDY